MAGTVAELESPAEEPLESWFRNRDLPAVDVETTQAPLGNDHGPVQIGTAASRIDDTEREASVGVDGSGDPVALHVESVRTRSEVITEWIAEVSELGLVIPESVHGADSKEYPFPLDLFYARTSREPYLLEFDVRAIHRAWEDDNTLGEVWMAGTKEETDEDEVNDVDIAYGYEAEQLSDLASIGLGFKRVWQGTVMRGVVYASGYVALYSCENASEFVRFVDGELRPFAERVETNDAQATLFDDEGGED